MENSLEKIEKNAEQSFKAAEEKVEQEIKKIEKEVVAAEKKLWHNKWFQSVGIVVILLAVTGGYLYYQKANTQISIDTSKISAPSIDLSPAAPGQLDEIYVTVGDKVAANQAVAKVGDNLIKTKVAGMIITANNNVGKTFSPGTPVVTMIDPNGLRVVATIDENKGLDQIRVGQLASFTVDAYGSKKYEGVVDEISPTSHQSDVVFNISNQRATQQFDVKIRFNQEKYPELKNGMSAKATIYK